MKKKLLWLLVPSFLLVGCGTGSAAGGGTTTNVPANAVKVHVTAQDFKWTLDKTTFQTGVPIDFIVISIDGTHGFSIPGTSISQTVSKGDAPYNVVWTPKQAGTYNITCNYYCGSGHGEMYAPITVTG